MAFPCIVAVPPRLESSRLPGKVIADIGCKPMTSGCLNAADRPQVFPQFCFAPTAPSLAAASGWGFDVILTSRACESGSERIASVADPVLLHSGISEPTSTLIINVQGDQLFIDPAVIDAMAVEFNHRSLT